ncbi:uncharacterized protein PAE49_023117 [Odontesthes bonariensis]
MEDQRRKLDGATRNQKAFQEDHNSRSGSNRGWSGVDTAASLLEAMENDSDCATDECSVAEASPATTPRSGKRKRSLFQENVLRDMMVADERNQERMLAQRERHLQLFLEDRREARRQKREARKQERQEEAADAAAATAAAAAAAFNQGILGVLGQLVQAIAGRNAAQPPQ